MKFTRQEKLILGILSIIVVGLGALGCGLIYFTYGPLLDLGDSPNSTENVSVPPTIGLPPSFTPTQVSTLTPTSSQTPDLMATSFVATLTTQVVVPSLTPITRVPHNTSIPDPPQQNPPQQNPTQQAASDCTAELNYAKSVHQYNLARIDTRYASLISFYESLLQQAVANRDAIAVSRYQRELESLRQQKNAAVRAENQRYESERAYIQSTCK